LAIHPVLVWSNIGEAVKQWNLQPVNGAKWCKRGFVTDPTSQPASSPSWKSALAIASLALGVRLLSDLETARVPTVRHLVGDAIGYYTWAQRIAAGDWMGSEGFYQAPLYPYVMAVWFRVFGESIWTVRIVQAALGAVGSAMLCLGAGRLWDRRVGITAGIMVALYGPAVYYDGIVQKASLAGFLTCALFAAIAWCMTSRASMPAGLVGLLLGLLSITRENALAWIAVLAAWFLLTRKVEDRRSAGWRPAVAFALGVGVVLIPVGLRNRVVSGEWSWSTFQAGPNFYIGNHRGADGRYQPLRRGHETPEFERSDATKIAQDALGRTLTAREVSRYWMDKGFDEIRADPAGWVRLLARKLLLVLNRYEIADAESLHVHRKSSWTLSVLTRVWHFGTIAPLAAAGMLAAWRTRRRLGVYPAMIATMVAAVAAFYVLGRYRYPIAVLMIPFAARGLFAIVEYARARAWRNLVVPVVVGVVVNVPVQDERRLSALAEMNAGVALAQAGELADATSLFRGALAEHPSSAEGHHNLALALALQGQFAEAVEHYQTALRLEPKLVGVEYNLGVALERIGRAAEALKHYTQAAADDPSDGEARAAVERLSKKEVE